jgi:hypothetical protein
VQVYNVAVEVCLGGVEAHPGDLETHPGALESHSGAMEAHPGAMEAGALHAHPKEPSCLTWVHGGSPWGHTVKKGSRVSRPQPGCH